MLKRVRKESTYEYNHMYKASKLSAQRILQSYSCNSKSELRHALCIRSYAIQTRNSRIFQNLISLSLFLHFLQSLFLFKLLAFLFYCLILSCIPLLPIFILFYIRAYIVRVHIIVTVFLVLFPFLLLNPFFFHSFLCKVINSMLLRSYYKGIIVFIHLLLNHFLF